MVTPLITMVTTPITILYPSDRTTPIASRNSNDISLNNPTID